MGKCVHVYVRLRLHVHDESLRVYISLACTRDCYHNMFHLLRYAGIPEAELPFLFMQDTPAPTDLSQSSAELQVPPLPAPPPRVISVRPTGDESSTQLGLHIVYKIVTDCGGTICAESEVGKGSAFTVSFPLCEVSVFAIVTCAYAINHRI